MPTAFFRSPADSLAGVPVQDKLRRRRRGLLLQEDKDQDFGPGKGPMIRAGDGRAGGATRGGPNMTQNRDITGSGTDIRPQDTQTGAVDRVAQFAGKSGSVGQEPSDRDEAKSDAAGSAYPQGEKEREEMSDGEVQSAVHKMVWDAIEYIDQELSPQRALATKYYQGEPFGNEEEGRSQFVATTLRDTVLQIMPSLMRIFVGADRAVEYAPLRPDQVEQAQQATEYVWEVVFHEDNAGYLELWKWFKDSLVKRLGVIKYWVDDASETKYFENSMMNQQQLQLLYNDEEIAVGDVKPSAGSPPGAMLFDVSYTQTKTERKIRIVTMPTEEYLFTRGARTTRSDRMYPGVALFVGHRTELTRSQLLESGIDEATIEAWAFKDVSLDHNQEEIARQHIVKPDTSAIGPIATQKALYIEGYPYLDVDGDGIAELRKVIMLGPSYHVISNEPCARRPFEVLCPDPEPHTIIGQGAGDWTMDLQKLDSSIIRGALDALALALNPRIGYVEGDANLSDILAPEIGSPIRLRSPQALVPIENQGAQAASAALQMLEKTQEIREERTGITKASAGLDADALQSTEKVAAAAQITAAQQHIETIARSFAEMGIAPLFRGILQLLVENPPAARMVKMRGKYVEMDPRSWDANLPVRVKVAIGAGLAGEKYAALSEQAQKMEGIFNTMGLANPIVTPKQYRDMLVRLAKLRGFVDADTFYQEVDPNWQPPQPQGNDPNMVIAQAEKQKADAHVAKTQADMAIDAQKHQAELVKHDKDMQLKERDILLTDQREREKMALEFQLKTEQMRLEHNLKVEQARIDAELNHAKVSAEQETKRRAQESESKARQTEAAGNSQKDKGADKTVRVVVAREKERE